MKRLASVLVLGGLTFGGASALRAQTKDIVKFAGEAVVPEGTTAADVVAIGGGVTVNGTVEGDAVAVGGSVALGPNAVVNGEAVSIGGVVLKSQGAAIKGKVTEVGFPKLAAAGLLPLGVFLGFLGLFKMIAFAGFIALALLIAGFFPAQIGKISYGIETDAAKAGLIGLAGLLLIVPIGALLLVSIVGILLIPAEVLFVVLALLVGNIAMAQLIGKKIVHALKKPGQPIVWETVWGLLLLWLAGWVPILGGAFRLVVLVMGFGGFLAAAYRAVRR